MERQVANVCGCLDGSVYLEPCEDSTDQFPDSSSLPVPWIAVSFANPRPKDTNHKSERKRPRLSRDADLHDAHNKLVAIRCLSLLARCPAYSWRGNPCFWWHALKNLCGAPYCDEYFSLPREQRSRQRRCCAPARDAGEVREMPKFRLVFLRVNVKNDMLALCAQTFSAPPNDIFRQVDQQVENLLARMGVVFRPQSRAVNIDLDFSRSKLRVGDSMNGIQSLLEAANGRGESTRGFFKIQCMNLSETTICERDWNVKYRFENRHHSEWLGCEGLPFKSRLALLSIPLVKA